MGGTRLVPFEERHLEPTLAWVNDPAVREGIGTVRPVSMAQHREWYAALQRDAGRLAMAIEHQGRPVGLTGLAGIDLRYRNAELWIYVGEAAARRAGVGREAVDGLLRMAFQDLGLHRVYVHVFDYNAAAAAFFRACGFREEGRLREAAFKQGRFCDKLVMAMLAHEYRLEEARS